MTTTPSPWTHWPLDPDRHVLQLDDRLLPPGLAVGLELHFVEGRSVGLWRLSQTGRVLSVVVGASC